MSDLFEILLQYPLLGSDKSSADKVSNHKHDKCPGS